MLNFYNKHIYLDFELFDFKGEQIIMFCDNPFYSKNQDNELHYETLTLKELINLPYKNVFMNVGQFKGFIKEWLNHCNLTTIIDYNNWIEDYFSCIKKASDIMGNNYDYTSYNSLFRQRQKWFIDNIEIYENESPIIINEIVEPEISFIIDDVLYSRKNNIISKYENIFNKNIEINNYKCFEYQSRTNIFGQNYLNFKPYNNCKSMSDLCYLYFPLSGEMINSNFIHIKKCLEKYLEN